MLYCVPTVGVFVVFQRLWVESSNNPLSLSLQVQARLNGTNILYASLVAGITLTGHRSAYVFTVPLFITLVTNIVIGLTGIANLSTFSDHTVNCIRLITVCVSFIPSIFIVKKWLYVHLIGQTFVVLWTTNFYHVLTGIMIPIAGRSGDTNNPDLTIAILCWAMTIYVTGFLVSDEGCFYSKICGH